MRSWGVAPGYCITRPWRCLEETHEMEQLPPSGGRLQRRELADEFS